MVRKSLAEASRDIFTANIDAKRAEREAQMHQGSTDIPQPNGAITEPLGHDTNEINFASIKAAEKAGPHATPPGTPPADASNEPLHKATDLHDAEDDEDELEEELIERLSELSEEELDEIANMSEEELDSLLETELYKEPTDYFNNKAGRRYSKYGKIGARIGRIAGAGIGAGLAGKRPLTGALVGVAAGHTIGSVAGKIVAGGTNALGALVKAAKKRKKIKESFDELSEDELNEVIEEQLSELTEEELDEVLEDVETSDLDENVKDEIFRHIHTAAHSLHNAANRAGEYAKSGKGILNTIKTKAKNAVGEAGREAAKHASHIGNAAKQGAARLAQIAGEHPQAVGAGAAGAAIAAGSAYMLAKHLHKKNQPKRRGRKMKEEVSIADRVAEYVKSGEGVNLDEDIKALFNGEQLSENFMKKAKVIFETAVIEKATAVCQEISEQYEESLNESVAQIEEALTDQVDDYLTYVAEQWAEDNKLALETGLKSELAEEFIGGLRNLFLEHYITIPEAETDVVEELAGKIENLEEKLSEEIDYSVALRKELVEHKKRAVLEGFSEGLTDTQYQKLVSLADKVQFDTPETYSEAVKTLKESYFPNGAVTTPSKAEKQLLDETVEGDPRGVVPEKTLDPEMQHVVDIIGKTSNK